MRQAAVLLVVVLHAVVRVVVLQIVVRRRIVVLQSLCFTIISRLRSNGSGALSLPVIALRPRPIRERRVHNAKQNSMYLRSIYVRGIVLDLEVRDKYEVSYTELSMI